MTVITCDDYTCQYNQDGFCKQAIVRMEVDEKEGKAVVVCQSYKGKEEETDGERMANR